MNLGETKKSPKKANTNLEEFVVPKVYKRNKKFFYRNKWYGFLMLAPGFILLTIFVIIPFIIALYRSVTDYYAYNDNIQFVWFDNYIRILQDESFFKSLGNVVMMTLIYASIMVVITFAFAHVIKKLTPKMAGLTKIICYVPHLLSGIVLSIIFLFIFSNNGLINAIRVDNGLERIIFNQDEWWPYFVIILPLLWGGFGYNSLVMLAGLLNIPNDYYEAASIDGANAWQKLTRITIPSMKNYFVLIIINLITGGLQMFELPMMMTGGGPLESTLTPVLFIYFQKQNPSLQECEIMAGSILVMIPIALINIFVFKVIRSEKSMD